MSLEIDFNQLFRSFFREKRLYLQLKNVLVFNKIVSLPIV